MHFKKYLKNIATHFPIPLTTNEYYDRLTEKIIKKVCNKRAACIDVGANEGKILSMFVKHCPFGRHYAFEPIPHLYFSLKRKYGSAVTIYKLALSNHTGESNFNFVLTDPAYSGLKKRDYDKPEKDEMIQVETAKLDDIINPDQPIQLIKLDIEGGEYNALSGAVNLLRKHHPTILFEFGKPGAAAYNISTAMMFDFFNEHQYKIYTMPHFLQQKNPLTLLQFEDCFKHGKPFFFIAH